MNNQPEMWKNDLTGILEVEYPIIQAPMFGVTTPEMVASAAESGALGSLSLGDLPAEKCLELIRATKTLTDKPFAVNIFLNPLPERTEEDGKIPEIGGISLLSQIHDHVHVPLIYAGGIYDAKTLLAAKLLGAQGFQIGSLLLGSAESSLQEFEKDRLKHISEKDIVLTKSFSGRYARGLKNIFTDTLDDSGYILPYPYQNKITAPLRMVAKLQQNPEFLSIWVGQSKSSYSGASTGDIIMNLVKETKNYKLNNEGRKF